MHKWAAQLRARCCCSVLGLAVALLLAVEPDTVAVPGDRSSGAFSVGGFPWTCARTQVPHPVCEPPSSVALRAAAPPFHVLSAEAPVHLLGAGWCSPVVVASFT